MIAFDELADPRFPGGTAAARDILDLPATRVERFRSTPIPPSSWSEAGVSSLGSLHLAISYDHKKHAVPMTSGDGIC